MKKDLVKLAENIKAVVSKIELRGECKKRPLETSDEETAVVPGST